ncbi:MAG: hypothetical protein H6622_03525 [Halobacteriovoraceae bacterium]|nr:hypothetical protein [Halobacteriovoraceae bacterium]
MAQKKEKGQEEEKKHPEIIKRYRDRLSMLKQAREYYQQDNVALAVKHYLIYLNSLARFHNTSEEKLRPKHFDLQKDVPELLMISQVYWDLSKAYDRNPRLHNESARCLEQFVTFTIGFKYQYINYQMLSKFVKKGQAYNQKAFKDALEKIRVNSKACYIATLCFGENHPHTNTLRKFKLSLLKRQSGKYFVDLYYIYSPHLVKFLLRHNALNFFITNLIIRPTLSLFSFIIEKIIMPK